MAARLTREQISARLKAERDAGGIVYDALCGAGITAKMAARGGADMVTTHILAYFRMQGLSSMAGYLPIGDANAITLELCERSLLNVRFEMSGDGGAAVRRPDPGHACLRRPLSRRWRGRLHELPHSGADRRQVPQ